MDVVVVVAIVAVFVGVVALVSRPLRRGVADVERDEAERLADLQAARAAKYAEIRELELDFRTGKLAQDEYRAQDRALRAQAIEILRALDALDVEPDPRAD